MPDVPAYPETTDLPCTRCAQPVPNSAALTTLLADLPAASPVAVLCPGCASDTPPTQEPTPTRVYRVTLAVQEAVGTAEEDWTDVGRFQLQGVAANVAAFVEAHNVEFGKRMQTILDFADQGDSTDG